MFYPCTDIPDFNIADSSLNIVETLDFKAELEDRFKNKELTGFIETRRKEPQIDPDTGYPVGMTEQQIKDKILKDQQREELEAAKEVDRIKLEATAKAEEEKKQQTLEQVKKDEMKEEILKFRQMEVEELKANLPEEPEDGPDSSTIQFRLPNSQSIQRRFMRTDKIKLMYDYVRSLGVKNGCGSGSNFEILQTFPLKVFDSSSHEKTLDEVGLFPRAKLHVKEDDEEEE